MPNFNHSRSTRRSLKQKFRLAKVTPNGIEELTYEKFQTALGNTRIKLNCNCIEDPDTFMMVLGKELYKI